MHFSGCRCTQPYLRADHIRENGATQTTAYARRSHGEENTGSSGSATGRGKLDRRRLERPSNDRGDGRGAFLMQTMVSPGLHCPHCALASRGPRLGSVSPTLRLSRNFGRRSRATTRRPLGRLCIGQSSGLGPPYRENGGRFARSILPDLFYAQLPLSAFSLLYGRGGCGAG
jgi:hypothetical protein